MDALFPIRYSVAGGTSQVDLTLEIAEDGSLAVEVLTESSLPQRHPVRLGRFAGRLEPALVRALTAWASALAASTSADMGTLSYGTVSRMVSTGRVASVVADDIPRDLEEALATAAEQTLAQPIAAVEVKAADDRLVIAGIGGEPYPVLLFARDVPGYWARVWRNVDGAPDGRVVLPRENMQALVDAGELAEGSVPLKAGGAISLPLPHVEGGGAGASGGFMFWRTGQGAERRLLVGTW